MEWSCSRWSLCSNLSYAFTQPSVDPSLLHPPPWASRMTALHWACFLLRVSPLSATSKVWRSIISSSLASLMSRDHRVVRRKMSYRCRWCQYPHQRASLYMPHHWVASRSIDRLTAASLPFPAAQSSGIQPSLPLTYPEHSDTFPDHLSWGSEAGGRVGWRSRQRRRPRLTVWTCSSRTKASWHFHLHTFPSLPSFPLRGLAAPSSRQHSHLWATSGIDSWTSI